MIRLLGRATLAALAVMAFQSFRRRQVQRQQERPLAEPEEMQTWEGEGGNPLSTIGPDTSAQEPRSMRH
jgi:DNA-binding protein H-NS